MTTIQLQQSVLQDVVSLLDDKEAMKTLQKVLQRLKQEKAAKQEMTDKDKAEILNDIKEGLHELKLMKQGKLKSRPVEELLDEISDRNFARFRQKVDEQLEKNPFQSIQKLMDRSTRLPLYPNSL